MDETAKEYEGQLLKDLPVDSSPQFCRSAPCPIFSPSFVIPACDKPVVYPMTGVNFRGAGSVASPSSVMMSSCEMPVGVSFAAKLHGRNALSSLLAAQSVWPPFLASTSMLVECSLPQLSLRCSLCTEMIFLPDIQSMSTSASVSTLLLGWVESHNSIYCGDLSEGSYATQNLHLCSQDLSMVNRTSLSGGAGDGNQSKPESSNTCLSRTVFVSCFQTARHDDFHYHETALGVLDKQESCCSGAEMASWHKSCHHDDEASGDHA